ncbi:MAG: DUF4230 domain-containing protein [Christensenellales bacterium]|jgi:hypothetical protein
MAKLKKIILAIVLLLIVCVLAGCIYLGCGQQKKADFSKINEIAELATYDCYYHNVASFEDTGNQFVIKYGNKKVWIEYTGVVTIGIDASKVNIVEKDKNVVEISIPPIKILSSKIEKDGVERVLPENGAFASISTEDQVAAIADAQKNMEEAAAKDHILFAQGKKRVKYLLENFVTTVGKQIGKSYEIEWIEAE